MRKLTFILGMFMLLMACHKYENGPFISFRSVKKRVIGDWKLVEYTVNGVDQYDSLVNGKEHWWKLKEDYSLIRETAGTQPLNGVWEIDSDNNIVVTMKVPLNLNGEFYFEKDTLDLTRLTNKEMWIEHVGRKVEKYEAQ